MMDMDYFYQVGSISAMCIDFKLLACFTGVSRMPFRELQHICILTVYIQCVCVCVYVCVCVCVCVSPQQTVAYSDSLLM